MTNWKNLLRDDIERFNALIHNLPVEQRTMLKGANLSNLDLTNADLEACDLSGTNLSDSKVPGYKLSTCRLQGTILTGMTVDNAYWETPIHQIEMIWKGADTWNQFRKTNTPHILSGTYFSNGRFQKIDFSDMNFASSVFIDAHFTGTILNEASFNGTTMDNAAFRNIDA